MQRITLAKARSEMKPSQEYAADDDNYDDTPLQNVRPFGSGLHRKKIAFVPASGDGKLKTTASSTATKPGQDVADIYLSVVLPEDAKPRPPATTMCEVCRLPLTSFAAEEGATEGDSKTATSHESSLAHQLCLPHSYPPSALDRSRMGLTYLSSHGWDPDSRRGLGVEQQGIQVPIKAKVKNDNLGIGMVVPGNILLPKKEKQLDAGKVRKLASEEKRKAARIRQQLSGRRDLDDLEKYLGRST